MADVVFDKLAFVDRLKLGGIEEEQARVHANALDGALRESVATKADIVGVKAEIAEVKVEIRAMEARIIKWLVPLLIGQTALIIAIVKML